MPPHRAAHDARTKSRTPNSRVSVPIRTVQIGVSRPPLPLADLPAPERVFKVRRIGPFEIVRFVLGPSMIALGASIGSGEWLLGPLAFGKYGFMGIGWLITLSAALQTLYNMEVARFTLATGEVPAVAFSRVPPGRLFWVPFTLFAILLGWLWGGWASAAGQSVFALAVGRVPDMASEIETVRMIGIGLMVLSFALFLYGKKIARTLEVFNTAAVWFVFAFVVAAAVLVVPAQKWGSAALSAVLPAAVPKGMDVSLLGGIVGYTGFGAGFNFMLINYYRDKGYGMGYRVGFISGAIGGTPQTVLSSGVTFPETKRNTAVWKRWWKYLAMDQWMIFFPGALVGMFVPGLLIAHLAGAPGAAVPDRSGMPVYAALELGRQHGAWLFPLTLAVGAFTLFKTQATILEMLIRNTTDSFYSTSLRFRHWVGGDIRRVYYSLGAIFVVLIGAIMHLALPTTLLVVSANLANLAAILFPFVVLFLNRKLPGPARIGVFGTLVLAANVVFFGFFFLNFLTMQCFGQPLVRF
ncbi:MAG TPA: Nramp family divalent metal transporter [bacterium]